MGHFRPAIKHVIAASVTLMLVMLLAFGLAAMPAAAASQQEAYCESVTEFDAPAWPFTRICFRGEWHPEYYPGMVHGGQLYVSSGNGADGANEFSSVQVCFYGSEVKLVTARYWQCGWCAVILDGRYRGAFNLSSPTPQFDYVLFEARRLRRGFHEIRVVNLGIPGSDDPIATEYDLHFINVDYMVVR